MSFTVGSSPLYEGLEQATYTHGLHTLYNNSLIPMLCLYCFANAGVLFEGQQKLVSLEMVAMKKKY